ncbi:MAG: phosphoribosylamine--glycine ligase [Thermoleophilia bacterium]|nr:phosphoribosylamine--glycine ligase [Thermoleophilia bacterium]
MRILIVGSGGREHALAASIAASPHCLEVHAAPGNPGISMIAKCHPIVADDSEGLVALARDLAVDLVVVGPEIPLVLGLADELRQIGIATFGPGAAAAKMEGSKAFTKQLLDAAGVDTAESYTVTDFAGAELAIGALGGACVVKADGLAAGKGVIVCDDATEAERAAKELLGGSLGIAGSVLVIEERMEGPEVSVLALCDGEAAVPLPSARDYKRIGEGGTGPNTGGMGAISPAPGVSDEQAQKIVDTVHKPILKELMRRGIRFTGCLYAGLMLTETGPRVLEFNVRFGDPETQAVLPRLGEDLLPWLLACAKGELEERPLKTYAGSAVAIVLASRGYPESSESGLPISGLADASIMRDTAIFQAGTAIAHGKVVTAGGRVLTVVARGANADSARAAAYAAADKVSFDGMQRRDDIGSDSQG